MLPGNCQTISMSDHLAHHRDTKDTENFYTFSSVFSASLWWPKTT